MSGIRTYLPREDATVERRQRIDTNVLANLKQFYDKDTDIQICKRRKIAETFRYDFSVGLWHGTAEEVMTIPWLNIEHYKRLLRKFMTDAHDYLTLFNFVGYYCLRDMTDWNENDDDDLPFGVIPLNVDDSKNYGEYVLVEHNDKMGREIEFNCMRKPIQNKYDFYVFDNGALFEDMTDDSLSSDLTIVSPFIELYGLKSLISEARVCLFDANFQSTHPESFLVTKPLPDTKPEMLPERLRYSMDSLASASQAQSIERMKLTSQLAGTYKNYLNRNNNRMNQMRAFKEGTSVSDATLHNERKAAFVRPDMKESLEILPELVDLSRGPSPASLVNLAELERQYENKICSLIDFPHFYLKPTLMDNSPGGLKSAGNQQQMTLAQNQLQDEVIRQQTLFQALFVEVYRHSLTQLDMNLVPAHLQRKIEARMHFKNVIRKSDEAIMSLVPLVQAGIVGPSEIRPLLVRNFGLEKTRPPDAKAQTAEKTKPKKEKDQKREKKRQKTS